ncbi:pseudouridylate synthase [Sulfodiicoccus acidiphilus]|uniref:Pseudouridylate synthase n=1 Tax=Sulfodiicoccus acidiphilus TaxID=1670455 RepID=A0A348B389_9CREN|nr:pseudouridylate synthase [Sulfodiicoccus acidiphilus]GGT95776.1 pseudouridylate synthase [Sulfodiicoccus acidiphilus]
MGRAFATLGRGHSNAERGKAIKLTLLMEIDRKVKDHEIPNLCQLKELFVNTGELARDLHRFYFGEDMEPRPCWLCSGKIEWMKVDFTNKARMVLKHQGFKRFLLGVKLGRELKGRELEFTSKEKGLFYESIKNELKREVGKILSQEGFLPDFENPEVELLYQVETGELQVLRKREELLVSYKRFCRGVSLSSWASTSPMSLESSIGARLSVPFSELSETRIFEDYPVVVKGQYIEPKESCFRLLKLGELRGKHRKLLFSAPPSKRMYRVTVVSDAPPAGSFHLAGPLYDITLVVSGPEELKSRLDDMNIEVLSVDLVIAEGKFKRIMQQSKTSNISDRV